MDTEPPPDQRRRERNAFLFLTVVTAPVIAGLTIAAYGFAVWVYQMIAGPPTG